MLEAPSLSRNKLEQPLSLTQANALYIRDYHVCSTLDRGQRLCLYEHMTNMTLQKYN